jgi:RND family efflux transporter MFP subunit
LSLRGFKKGKVLNMNKKILFIIIIILFMVAALLVNIFIIPKKEAVISPHLGQAVEAVYATGNVEPTIMVPISPRVTAHLIELMAVEGQTVKKGDILARLEDNEQKAAIADLTAKLIFAEKDLNRKLELLKTKSISKDFLDSAQSEFDSLTAQIEKAKAQASYLTLIAPADGLIIKKDGEIGELITSGQPILYMSCCAPLRISSEVDEEDIPKIKLDQPVLIQSDAFPDKIYNGKIIGITPMGDSVARSYRVRIGFDTNDHPFMIGMTVETNIIIQKIDNATLIPQKALGKNNMVQRVQGNVVQLTKVETGIQNTDTIQITSGLTPSDTAVIPYNEDLEDGQKIRTEIYQEGAK